jgi:tetratricopeptide (TPR) repeat protein
MDHGTELTEEAARRLEANVRHLLGIAQETFVTLQAICGFGSRTTVYNLIAGKSATAESRERLAAGLRDLVRRRLPEYPPFAWQDLVERSLAGEVGATSTMTMDVLERSFDEATGGEFDAEERKTLAKAARALKAGAERARVEGNKTGYRSKLFSVALLHEQLGQDSQTLETLRQLIQVEGELGDSIAKARAMARAAWAAYRLQDLGEAKRFAEDTLRILERTLPVNHADVRTWLKALDCLAMVLAHERQFREAIRRLEQSLEKRMHLDCPLLRAASLYRLGRVHEMEGDWEMAHCCFEDAFHLRRAHGASAEAAKTAIHLVRICLATGRLKEAEAALDSVHQGSVDAQLTSELISLRERLRAARAARTEDTPQAKS